MDNGELTAHLVLRRCRVLDQQRCITWSHCAHQNCEEEEKWGRSPDPPALGEVCLGSPTLGFGATLPSRSRTRSPVAVCRRRFALWCCWGWLCCSALLHASGRSLALLPWGEELGGLWILPKGCSIQAVGASPFQQILLILNVAHSAFRISL